MTLNKYKIILVTLICCNIWSCASDNLMHKPIAFEQSSEFLRQLNQLEQNLTEKQYNDLTTTS